MQAFFRKTAFITLSLFFFLLPFHGFLMTFMRFRLGVTSEFVPAWREIVLIILTLLAIPLWKPRQWLNEERRLKIIIFLFFTLGLIFLIFQKENIQQWILGARYDFEFLYFFLLVPIFGFEKKELRTFLKSTIAAAVIVIIFGLVLQFLPQNFLTQFGYVPYQDEWVKGNALFSCHYVEFRNDFCRLQSTFGSPGRYASYLIFIVALAGTYAFSASRKGWKWFWTGLFTLGMISLALTLSRSFWISTGVMIGVALFQFQRIFRKSTRFCNRKSIFQKFPGSIKFFGSVKLFERGKWTKIKKMWSLIVCLPLLLFLTVFILSPSISENVSTLLRRSASTSEHLKALERGVRTVSEHPFGLGLGTAGPASASFEKLLTENAYLQIMVEMGIVGGIIFFLILMEMLRLLCRSLKAVTYPEKIIDLEKVTATEKIAPRLTKTIEYFPGFPQILAYSCFLTLIGLMVGGLFVHSFEETSLNLTLFGFMGILFDKNKKRDQIKP